MVLCPFVTSTPDAVQVLIDSIVQIFASSPSSNIFAMASGDKVRIGPMIATSKPSLPTCQQLDCSMYLAATEGILGLWQAIQAVVKG